MLKKIISPFSVILLTAFLDILGMGLIIPLLPTIVRDFLSPALIAADPFTHSIIRFLGMISPDPVSLANGLAFSIFSVGMLVGGMLFGHLSDSIGRKKTLAFTTVLGIVGYLIFGLSTSFLPFLIGRLISGFSGAGLSVAQAYISDIFAPSERAAKMGMIGAAFGAGFTIGPALGGLISHWGLHLVGLVSAGVVFINFLLVILVLPEPKHHMAEMDRSDLSPIDQKKVFPIYVVSFLATFGFSAMQSTFGMIIPDRFHQTAEVVGYLMGIVGIASILYQGFAIAYMRRIFLEKGMILFGLSVMGIAFAAFAANPYFILVPFLQIFFPIGFGSLNASTSALLSKSAPGHAGKVLGSNAAATSLAGIFGPLVASALYGVSLMGATVFGFRISAFAPFAELPGFAPFAASAVLFVLSIPFAYFAIRGHRIWTPSK